MAATKQDIEKWFDAGIEREAIYMLIVCDTFDYNDYPVYKFSDEGCLEKFNNPGSMQEIMEVYDLRVDKTEQMSACRSMRLPQLVKQETK